MSRAAQDGAADAREALGDLDRRSPEDRALVERWIAHQGHDEEAAAAWRASGLPVSARGAYERAYREAASEAYRRWLQYA